MEFIVPYFIVGIAVGYACRPWSDRGLTIFTSQEQAYSQPGLTLYIIVIAAFWPLILAGAIYAGIVEWRRALERFQQRRDRYTSTN